MTLKEIRLSKKVTQSEAANILSVSLRSYKEYENNIEKNKTLKYSYLCEKLSAYNVLDEEHGVLTINEISERVGQVLEKYEVNFCYLNAPHLRCSV